MRGGRAAAAADGRLFPDADGGSAGLNVERMIDTEHETNDEALLLLFWSLVWKLRISSEETKERNLSTDFRIVFVLPLIALTTVVSVCQLASTAT